jgi:hypothetical protein
MYIDVNLKVRGTISEEPVLRAGENRFHVVFVDKAAKGRAKVQVGAVQDINNGLCVSGV